MKKKKWFKALLGLSLSVVMLAGCSSGTGGNAGGESPPPATNAPEAAGSTNAPAEEADPYLISETPIELGIHMHYWDTSVFDDEWGVYKEAAELTNVSLKGTASKAATKSKEVFSLMLASNNIPDIVHFDNRTELTKYGLEGAFLDLAPLIEEHAPNLKAFLNEHPDVRKAISTLEGQIFVIPYMPDGTVAQGWHVRQDWLDALGLEQPTTLDEYVEVLRAFRDGDPNRNGLKDEVPYFNRDSKHGPYRPLIFWDARKDWRVVDDKVVYGPLEPQFKTAMIELAGWYAEGLIDQEIFTRGNASRDVLFGDNLGGSTHDWFTSTINYNSTLTDQVPGFHIAAIAPPAGTDGVQREETSRAIVNATGWSISSGTKYPVEAVKYLDFWFTDKGRTLQNFGIEGETYDLVDGKPQLRPNILEGSFANNLKEYGAYHEVGVYQDYESELQSMAPEARAAVEMYESSGYPVAPNPSLVYTLEQQEKISELQTNLETYTLEQMQKWMLGAESVEATYDNFVKGLENLGVHELISVRQAAYDAYVGG